MSSHVTSEYLHAILSSEWSIEENEAANGVTVTGQAEEGKTMTRSISVAWFLFLILATESSAQEGSWVPLRGKVRTLLTETLQYSDSSKGELSVTFSDYQVFDPQGKEVELVFRGRDGQVASHLTRTFNDAGQVLSEAFTSDKPNDSFTSQNFYDEQGKLRESVTYNGSGKVTLRLKYEKDSSGANVTTVEQNPPSGMPNEMVVKQKYDPVADETVTITTKNGKPERESHLQRDATGNLFGTEIDISNGNSSQTERKSDGTRTENVYSPSDKTRTSKTTDSQGRVLSFVKESPSSCTQSEYRYDEANRLVELTQFDGSGKLTGRETTEYQDDLAHNWIEQKWTRWDTRTEPQRAKLILIRRRTIGYYE
jgi:hypothetical protein